jgi:hypothetical protein
MDINMKGAFNMVQAVIGINGKTAMDNLNVSRRDGLAMLADQIFCFQRSHVGFTVLDQGTWRQWDKC